MQHVPSSSVVFHGSPAQTRRFSPLKSGFHQHILFTSPAKNSSENPDVDKISKVAKLCERIYVRLEEINKKTDTIIMNQGRLNRSLLPNEKRFQKPINLPALPVKTEDQLNLLETFLEDENNFAAVDMISTFGCNWGALEDTVGPEFGSLGSQGIVCRLLTIRKQMSGSLLIKFDDTALFEAEETMKTWLANAPWRKQDNETYGKRCVKRKLEVNTAK
ncbi:uncharacterized protein LOC115236924 [Formica exsecta]|uniref:uncharacterized protein LOC115236924 n=1 Tax=Formica exsecta TaxID=72781 RepID=UPI00114255A7|nr:uncharacterized protein LOC115236924 [Formica exsecta]